MGRQLSLEDHCLLCLKDITTAAYGHGNAKQLYERIHNQGFSGIAQVCNDCLGYLRGGNWPSEVYAKLWSKELATERALRDAGLPEAPEIEA